MIGGMVIEIPEAEKEIYLDFWCPADVDLLVKCKSDQERIMIIKTILNIS